MPATKPKIEATSRDTWLFMLHDIYNNHHADIDFWYFLYQKLPEINKKPFLMQYLHRINLHFANRELHRSVEIFHY